MIRILYYLLRLIFVGGVRRFVKFVLFFIFLTSVFASMMGPATHELINLLTLILVLALIYWIMAPGR